MYAIRSYYGPGPVFVELPFDILFNPIDLVETLPKVTVEPIAPEIGDVQRMFELLRSSQKPLIIAGTQVYWDEAHDRITSYNVCYTKLLRAWLPGLEPL